MSSSYKGQYPKTEEEFLTGLREIIAKYPGGSGLASEVGIIVGAKEDAEDNYSAGAYLMRDAAVLAFNYASHIAGASGFQASIAAMDAYGSIVGIDNFGIMQMDDLLYPQYNLRDKLEKWINDAMPRLQEKARELLAKDDGMAHESVRDWWKHLAAGGRP